MREIAPETANHERQVLAALEYQVPKSILPRHRAIQSIARKLKHTKAKYHLVAKGQVQAVKGRCPRTSRHHAPSPLDITYVTPISFLERIH